MITEHDLVQQAKKGDERAIEELLQRNYPILKGYLLKITLDPELAADLTQETMFKAVRQLKKFKEQSKLSTWLITIATNLYRDYQRKNRHLPVAEDPANLEQRLGQADYSGAEIGDGLVDDLLARLPQDKRAVLILKHYFGYNYQEISKILNCPVGTVKSRMYYCLEFLQKQMEGGKGA